MEVSESEEDSIAAPLEIETVEASMPSLLPEKSKGHYENTYKQFKEWCDRNEVAEVTENVLLKYLEEKSKRVKAPTLWSIYSMLKATLMVNENLDVKKFKRLLPYLKKKSVGHCANRSQVFSREQINQFLREAHNDSYLMMKVVLIMGIAGTCRRDELTQMTVDDVQDVGSILIVKVPDRKTNTRRTFTVTSSYHIDLYRRYVALRPSRCSSRRLFIKYDRGKCANQVVGIHTIGAVPSLIAKYLQLPNPKTYTGHCFRRTSVAFQRHGGFVEDLIEDVAKFSTKIQDSKRSNVHVPSTSSTETDTASSSGMQAPLPNVPARDLKLPCPARNNTAEEFTRRHRALTIFKHLCPSTLTVRDLYPNGGGSNSCSWRVEYDVKSDISQLSDDRTVNELYGRQPFYTKITWEEKTCLPPCWNVEYSIINCNCGNGVDSIKLEDTGVDFECFLNPEIKLELDFIKMEN